MQTPRRIAVLTVLALPFALGGYSHSFAHAQPRPGTPAALHDDDDHNRGQDARMQGHEDGRRAAYDDMQDGRPPDADRHQDFRHPPVGRHWRDAYRQGFRDGYRDAYQNGGRRGGDRDDRNYNYNPH